jgi:hypothetical protein
MGAPGGPRFAAGIRTAGFTGGGFAGVRERRGPQRSADEGGPPPPPGRLGARGEVRWFSGVVGPRGGGDPQRKRERPRSAGVPSCRRPRRGTPGRLRTGPLLAGPGGAPSWGDRRRGSRRGSSSEGGGGGGGGDVASSGCLRGTSGAPAGDPQAGGQQFEAGAGSLLPGGGTMGPRGGPRASPRSGQQDRGRRGCDPAVRRPRPREGRCRGGARAGQGAAGRGRRRALSTVVLAAALRGGRGEPRSRGGGGDALRLPRGGTGGLALSGGLGGGGGSGGRAGGPSPGGTSGAPRLVPSWGTGLGGSALGLSVLAGRRPAAIPRGHRDLLPAPPPGGRPRRAEGWGEPLSVDPTTLTEGREGPAEWGGGGNL